MLIRIEGGGLYPETPCVTGVQLTIELSRCDAASPSDDAFEGGVAFVFAGVQVKRRLHTAAKQLARFLEGLGPILRGQCGSATLLDVGACEVLALTACLERRRLCLLRAYWPGSQVRGGELHPGEFNEYVPVRSPREPVMLWLAEGVVLAHPEVERLAAYLEQALT